LELNKPYPEYIVRAVLEHWDEIEDIKYRTPTPILVASEYVDDPEDFYMEEGHTLMQRGSKSTRVPHNSHAIIEALCDITVDIERARKETLDQSEDLAFVAFFMFKINGPRIKAEAALIKVLAFLNAA
jgi:hypothetical protein